MDNGPGAAGQVHEVREVVGVMLLFGSPPPGLHNGPVVPVELDDGVPTWRFTQVASINYAFDPPETTYDDEGQMFLDLLNPQSELSEALLAMFAELIEKDRDYHDRLVRHYEMWKRVINDPEHPAHESINTAEPGYGILRNQQPTRRSEQKIGANEPCPCGSGRKYKKCCRA